MGTKTRRGFLVATVSCGFAVLMAGCGGGTPDNSPYQGTYRSQYTIPSLNESGFFSFTVDIKGKLNGSFTNSVNNTVRSVSGTLKSTGKFDGSTNINGLSGSVNGTLSTGTATGSTPGGDFTLKESGVSSAGSFVLSSSGDQYNPQTSQFRGAYSGSFNGAGADGVGGQVSYSIDSTGHITGSFTNTKETGLFTGQVQNSGAFTGTVAYPSGTVPITGTLQASTSGVAIGNYVQTVSGQQVAGSFGPSTVVSGDSPYKGAYRGTYGIPEQSENGNVSFTIDPSGDITGFFSQANNSPVATFSGKFTNNGLFSGLLTYDSSTGIPQRPITGKLGTTTVAGATGLSGDFVLTVGKTNTSQGKNYPGNMEVSVGGSEPDSNYRAAYTGSNKFNVSFDASSVPGSAIISASEATSPPQPVTFNIDKEGSLIGSFGSQLLDGRITNDGRVVGFIKGLDGNKYAFRGVYNKVIWTFAPDDKEPGIAGNMLVTVNGKEYPAVLKVIGGDGVTKSQKAK